MNSASFRVRIDFSELSTPSCRNKAAWYLLNPTVSDSVKQLKKRVRHWFGIENASSDIEVWLDNYTVPDKESVLLFKPDDLVVLRSRCNAVNGGQREAELSYEAKRKSKKCVKLKNYKGISPNARKVENGIDYKDASDKERDKNEEVTRQKKKKKKHATKSEETDKVPKKKKKKKRRQDSGPSNDAEEPSIKRLKGDRHCSEQIVNEGENYRVQRKEKRKKREKTVVSEREIKEAALAGLGNIERIDEHQKQQETKSSLRRQRRKLTKGRHQTMNQMVNRETEAPKTQQSDSTTTATSNRHIEDRHDTEPRYDPLNSEEAHTNEASDRCHQLEMNHESGIARRRRMLRSESKRYAEMAENEVLTNTSTVLPNLTDDQTSCAKQSVDYSVKYPLLDGPPRVNDIIAYKTLELSENYTPEVTDFKVAKVLTYDSERREVFLKLREPVAIGNRKGKFELVSSNEDEDENETGNEAPEEILVHEVTLDVASFVEIRLVTDETIV